MKGEVGDKESPQVSFKPPPLANISTISPSQGVLTSAPYSSFPWE